jgi:hypothetical protein
MIQRAAMLRHWPCNPRADKNPALPRGLRLGIPTLRGSTCYRKMPDAYWRLHLHFALDSANGQARYGQRLGNTVQAMGIETGQLLFPGHANRHRVERERAQKVAPHTLLGLHQRAGRSVDPIDS